MSDPQFEPVSPLPDVKIDQIEKVLGRELPKDYCDFIKQYGGAFVGGLIDGSLQLPILTFFGADEKTGILAKLQTHPDFRDDGVLPIADCELGNLYILSRENAVHYINYYGGETTARKVADSFQEFVSRIVVSND